MTQHKSVEAGHIPFTQFKRPDGRAVPVTLPCSPSIAEKAASIIESGLRFECEVLQTGYIGATITHPEDGDLDIVVVPNGPGVREAIEEMVTRFDARATLSSARGNQS